MRSWLLVILHAGNGQRFNVGSFEGYPVSNAKLQLAGFNEGRASGVKQYATDAFREAWDRIGLGNISSRVARVVMTNIYTFPVPELPTGGDYWPIRTGIGRRNALLRL